MPNKITVQYDIALGNLFQNPIHKGVTVDESRLQALSDQFDPEDQSRIIIDLLHDDTLRKELESDETGGVSIDLRTATQDMLFIPERIRQYAGNYDTYIALYLGGGVAAALADRKARRQMHLIEWTHGFLEPGIESRAAAKYWAQKQAEQFARDANLYKNEMTLNERLAHELFHAVCDQSQGRSFKKSTLRSLFNILVRRTGNLGVPLPPKLYVLSHSVLPEEREAHKAGKAMRTSRILEFL